MAGQKWIVIFTFLALFSLGCTGVSVTICEHHKTTIRCAAGKSIKVLVASYGRHDRSTCPHPNIRTTSCHAWSSFSVVKSRCNNKPSCELYASNSVFGDPCKGTYKYLKVMFTCIQIPLKSVVICEHRRATLNCPGGKKIHVLSASYGRHDRSTCPHPPIRTTSCHAGNSLAIVSCRCNNKYSCSLFASNSVFGDPCRGTYKYMQAKYKCI